MPPKKPVSLKKRAEPVVESDDDPIILEDSDEEEDASPPQNKSIPVKPSTRRRQAVVIEDDSSEEEATPTPKKKGRTPPKRTVESSDESTDERPVTPKTKAKPSKTKTGTPSPKSKRPTPSKRTVETEDEEEATPTPQKRPSPGVVPAKKNRDRPLPNRTVKHGNIFDNPDAIDAEGPEDKDNVSDEDEEEDEEKFNRAEYEALKDPNAPTALVVAIRKKLQTTKSKKDMEGLYLKQLETIERQRARQTKTAPKKKKGEPRILVGKVTLPSYEEMKTVVDRSERAPLDEQSSGRKQLPNAQPVSYNLQELAILGAPGIDITRFTATRATNSSGHYSHEDQVAFNKAIGLPYAGSKDMVYCNAVTWYQNSVEQQTK